MEVSEIKTNLNLIGIAGVAGSGKDTFAGLIAKIFENSGAEVNYLSFAAKLKSEVAGISKKLYDIDPTDCSRDEKNLIRPLLFGSWSYNEGENRGSILD